MLNDNKNGQEAEKRVKKYKRVIFTIIENPRRREQRRISLK